MSARDALIASITGLMRRRGVAGTGLNALLEDSGVSRRTVYLNFPGGKAELVTEATRIAGQALTTVLRSADDGRDPAQAVQVFIDQWKVALRATEMEAGCPIVAAILGRSEAPGAALAAAEAVGVEPTTTTRAHWRPWPSPRSKALSSLRWPRSQRTRSTMSGVT
jgi:AcrR family transcriptional regulator